MRAATTVLSIILVALVPRLAHGQSGQERARALNKAGMAEFDLGEYGKAIEDFRQAYELYPDAKILFNAAQAHRKLKLNERALDLYRSYLRNMPNAPNRAVVEELIAELEGLIAAEKASDGKPPQGVVPPPPAPATAPATRPEVQEAPTVLESRWYTDTWGWALVGAGVAAGAVGVGFLVSSNSLEGDLQTATESERPGLRTSIDNRRTIATVAFVAGGALVVGGIVKFALHRPEKSSDSATRAVIGPGWVALQGRF